MGKVHSLALLMIFLLTTTTASFMWAQETTPAAREKVALIVSIKGQSEIIGPDHQRRPGKIGSHLRIGDRVVTKRTASIQLRFVDNSTISLAGDADLTINEYAFGKDKAKPKSEVTIRNGTFRFLAGKISKIAPENFKIKTETATIGIRGSGGVGRTSDGTNGRPASLVIATIAGHVLEVTTRSGAVFVVDDPDQALSIDAEGFGSWFLMIDPLIPLSVEQQQSQRLAQQAPQEEPIPQHRGVALAFYRRGRAIVWHRRQFSKGSADKRLLRLVVDALMRQLGTEKQRSHRDEDVDTGKERGSFVGVLERLSEESRQSRPSSSAGFSCGRLSPLSRIQSMGCRDLLAACEREASSAQSVLGRLSEEQKAVGEAQESLRAILPNSIR